MKVEEFVEQIIDYRGRTPHKTSAGIPLITAKVIKGGRILQTGEFITEETYASWMRRGLPQQWDLLLTTEAPLGEVALLRTSERIALAQRVILLRGHADLVDQRYLSYTFQSPLVQERLRARATGTTVQGIKQSELRQVDVPLPPLSTQKKTAAVLAAYDELIENNLRRIEILEEMAQTLYREWFVEFRFPGYEDVEMVDSDLGLTPKGWTATHLAAVAEVNAKSIRKGTAPERINYIDISSVGARRVDEIKEMAFADAPSRARRVVSSGDVIWSTVRPNRRSFALMLQPSPNTIASTGFAVLTPTKVPSTYLYEWSATDDFASYLTNHARGAAYPAVNAEDFENARVVLPTPELLHRFDDVTSPMLGLSHNLARQNANLRATRDLLLPKLVSGEIDVSDLDIDTAWLVA